MITTNLMIFNILFFELMNIEAVHEKRRKRENWRDGNKEKDRERHSKCMVFIGNICNNQIWVFIRNICNNQVWAVGSKIFHLDDSNL